MMTFNHKSACPSCATAIEMSRAAFRSNFRCPHCGVALQVSPLYSRVLVVLSFLVGYALAWEIGAYLFGVPWGFFILCIPFAFFVAILFVRIAPVLVPPKLVLNRPSRFLTTIDLKPEPNEDT
jgi:hypothetical protein